MFNHISSYFNVDPRWQVLTTTGQEYQVQGPQHQIDKKAEQTLEAMRSVIDLTHTFSSNATKVLVYFTAFNVVCYHFTGWISGVALMYAITIVIFGWISHDFSTLEAGSLRLKETFVLIIGSRREPTHHTWEEIEALDQREREYPLRDYQMGTAVLREEDSSLNIRDPKIQVQTTLIHVRSAIREIERLRNSLPILNYYPLPLRTPLKNFSINLRSIETHLAGLLQG